MSTTTPEFAVISYSVQVSAGNAEAVPVAVGDAHGGAARSDLARPDSQKSRLHAFHRRARPCWTGQRRRRQALLGPYQAQELFKKHEADIGVTMVPFNMMVYLEAEDRYVPDDEVKPTDRVLNISGTELRQRLNEGRDIPGWFTYPEVVQELRRSFPPRSKQGVTIFFTGLSGSGKSTIANVLLTKFLEVGGRPVTLLDGDLVRKHLFF